MTRTYRYNKDFKLKSKAKAHAKKLRSQKRFAIVKKLSVGRKKYRYFVYATRKRKK